MHPTTNYYITPIQTRYKGFHFRSRLEARFAVLLDEMDIDWKYEDEGYKLGKTEKYLPDFIIKIGNGDDFYIEVKPEYPTIEEINKMSNLCRGKQMPGYIVFGSFFPPHINKKRLGKIIIDQKNGRKISYKEFFNIIKGMIMIGFTKEGFIVSDYRTFAYTRGGKHFDIWTFYLNPEDTFKEKYPLYIGETTKNQLLLFNNGRNESMSIELITDPIYIQNEKYQYIGNYIVLDTISNPLCDQDDTPFEGFCKNKENIILHQRFYNGDGITYDHEDLIRAYNAAKSARFEHGESGAT